MWLKGGITINKLAMCLTICMCMPMIFLKDFEIDHFR